MQAQLKPPRLRVQVLFLYALLEIIIGTVLFAGNSISVEASHPGQKFKAHTIELRLAVDKIGSIDNTKAASVKAHGDPVQFPCQSNSNPRPILCYGPYQMREAYGINELLKQNITGQGRSIAIIDAYGSPTLRKDVHAFNATWGLPETSLHIYEPYGHQKADSSWVAETSLDVEWAHVMAPGATINLVVAKSSNDVDIYYAIKYAIEQNLGDVISLSFGENEACIDPSLRMAEHKLFASALQKGITILAATGDTGSAQATCSGKDFVEATSYPASDPLVTAVGGTALNADAVTGTYHSESAWNEAGVTNRAGGGGY
ncbi:MAG TPA: S8 family serine peptidase, partial [Ktedonobacteraceae bacterium]|nr:S8 family serine peptidase [Ktedonobacteraceae bacterium]